MFVFHLFATRVARLLGVFSVLLALLPAAFAAPTALAAGAGALDTTFGSDQGNNGPDGTILQLVVQPDGKIIVAGAFFHFNGETHNSIVRLNPDGSLDRSFKGDLGFQATVRAVILQPDGKIVVGGSFGVFDANGVGHANIVRLNADGTIDTSIDPQLGTSTNVFALARQPDGKIVVGGSFGIANGVYVNRLARLNPDTSLDTSFNPGSGPDSYVYKIGVQPDGKIIISGLFGSVNGTPRSNIARLNADGSLDTSFAPEGSLALAAIQPNGKLLVSETSFDSNGYTQIRLVRFNADGTRDTSFASPVVENSLVAVALQPDGKIVIGGNFHAVGGVPRSFVARLNADGTLDTGFDPGYGPDQSVNAVAIQPDGRVIIGGNFVSVDGFSYHHIARLLGDEVKTGLPVLDTFDRANGALGSNYVGYTGGYQIAQNAVQVLGGGDLYWKTQFGTAQAAAITLKSINTSASGIAIVLKAQGGSTPNGHKGAIVVGYDPKAQVVQVATVHADGSVTGYAKMPLTLANGDTFGASVDAQGVVRVFKNGQLAATVTLNAADQQFFNTKGGAIGVGVVNGSGTVFDDFKGGTAQ